MRLTIGNVLSRNNAANPVTVDSSVALSNSLPYVRNGCSSRYWPESGTRDSSVKYRLPRMYTANMLHFSHFTYLLGHVLRITGIQAVMNTRGINMQMICINAYPSSPFLY